MGFSYRKDPNEAALARLRQVSSDIKLLSRDPASERNIVRLTGRRTVLSADLAFLMAPTQDSRRVSEVLAWIAAQRERGRLVIGINCNRQVLPSSDPNEISRLVENYMFAMTAVMNSRPNVSFLIVPHDTRGQLSDLTLGEDLFSRCPAVVASNSRLISEPWTASEIKAAAGALDLVVTGRMHLAIAALGMGVPVVSLTYQDKFEGLYEHFDMPLAGAPGEDALKEGVLFNLIEDGIRTIDTSRAQIRRKLPSVVALARRNIEILLGTGDKDSRGDA